MIAKLSSTRAVLLAYFVQDFCFFLILFPERGNTSVPDIFTSVQFPDLGTVGYFSSSSSFSIFFSQEKEETRKNIVDNGGPKPVRAGFQWNSIYFL